MRASLGDWLGNPPVDRLLYGVAVGLVTNIEDPDSLGRVKVSFPWLSAEDESAWARIATLMAGKDRGTLFVPEVGDEVLVAFEHGRAEFPFIVGALWNGKDSLPEPVEKDNNVRTIKTRSGHTLRFDDTDGAEKIEIIDAKEKNRIVIDTAKASIEITADDPITITAGGDLTIDAGGTLSMKGNEVKIESQSNSTLEVGGNLEAKASGQTTIKGATVNIN